MLFDLQGKRRRVVQATYLMLAVLMGGGLVLFGIGGDVSGGLFDAFSDRGGGGGSDDTVEKRIERNEERAAAGGSARETALRELVRDYYSLATNQAETGAVGFPEEARDELTKAAAAYQRYLKVETENPDPATANYAIQIYDVTALNDADEAKKAATIVAEEDNDWQSYLRLAQYATLAQDTRTADLAGAKALDLAGKGEKREVRRQLKLVKQQAAAAPGGNGSATGE
jgi:hypothetical protein